MVRAMSRMAVVGILAVTVAAAVAAGIAFTRGERAPPRVPTHAAEASFTPVPQAAEIENWDAARLTFSLDGSCVAGASEHGLFVWDVATGAVVARFDAETSPFRWGGPRYSIDGSLLASRTAGKVITVIDTATYEVVARLRAPDVNAQPVSLTIGEANDGRPVLATTYYDRLALWDSEDWGLHEPPQPAGVRAMLPMAYAPSERRFVLADSDERCIHLVSADGADPQVIEWPGDDGGGAALRLIVEPKASDAFVARDGEETPSVWELRDGKMVSRGPRLDALRGQEVMLIGGGTQALAWSPGLSATLMRRLDGFQIWDTETGEMIREFGPGVEPHEVVVTPDGSLLAARTGSKWELWDIETGKRMGDLDLAGCAAFEGRVAVSPDGGLVASTAPNGSVLLWDTATARLVADAGDSGHGPPGFFCFSRDGSHLVRSSTQGVTVWRVPSGRREMVIDQAGDTLFGCVALSPDGSVAAVASEGPGVHHSTLRLYDTATGESIRTVLDQSHSVRIRTLSYSADGSRLLVSGHEGKPPGAFGRCRLLLIDARTSRILWERNDCYEPAYGFPMTGDGRYAITQAGGRVQALDADSGETIDESDLGRAPETLQVAADGGMLLFANTSYDIEPVTHIMAPLTWRPIAEKPPPWRRWTAPGPRGRWYARSTNAGIELCDARTGGTRVTFWAIPAPREGTRQTRQGEWLAWTPDGYWTGSDGAEKHMRWRDEEGRPWTADQVPELRDAGRLREALVD
jgi:WD40 repeat protein